MQKNKHAKPISFWTSRLALLLLLLSVAVAYIFVGTFAKYTSSSEGSDSARVARFAVSATFDGAQNSHTIDCRNFEGQTEEQILENGNARVFYSPIVLRNTQTVDDVLYIAETSQKVDVTVACSEALHEIYGLEFRLLYQDENSQTVYAEYQGSPVIDDDGRYVYTFPSVATFPVQTDSVNGGLLAQSKNCELMIYLTSDSVQPITSTIFVGAVGTQLD